MSGTIIKLRGAEEAPRKERSKMETLLINQGLIGSWKLPSFQRDFRENEKVREIAEELKENGGIIEGVITLGAVRKTPDTLYILDGQHRLGAARLSELPEFIADIRIVVLDDMADLAREYVRLNSKIRNMTPDDVLRASEGDVPILAAVRRNCPFVGYANIRRYPESPVLSMSAVIRCWRGSHNETPTTSASGQSALEQARDMTKEDADLLVAFLNLAFEAWQRDKANNRLYGNLNMTMCMWLYRRLVVQRDRGVRRYAVLTPSLFKRCLMALSADGDYIAWLYGRSMKERDRGPCFTRIKAVFVRCLREAEQTNLKLPQPNWAAK